MSSLTPGDIAAITGAPGSAPTSGSPGTDPLSDVTRQVESEIASQTGGYQSAIDSARRGEATALQNIGNEYGALLPYVQKEADWVKSSYDEAFSMSQNIFSQAQQNMNALRQNRGAEAQQLAQQIGGPVAVGEFDASVLPSAQELAATAPNSLLHFLANAQAGVQEAGEFAQRVFPLHQTEDEAQARNYFEDQVRQNQDQINSLNSQKTTLINSRYNDLLQQQRQYELQLSQLKLDQLKADRDYKLALKGINQEQQRINITRGSEATRTAATVAGLTGKYKGKPTLEAIKLNDQQQIAAAKLGLSKAQYAEQLRHHLVTEQQGQQRLQNQAKAKAASIIDALMTPGGKAGVHFTKRSYLTDAEGSSQRLLNPGKVFYNPKAPKGKRYWTENSVSLTPNQARAQGLTPPGGNGIHDPQQLYQALRAAGVTPSVARSTVQLRTGIKDYQPGKSINYTHDELGSFSNEELMTIAKKRGFNLIETPHPTRGVIVQFILMNNPNKKTAGMGNPPNHPGTN